jgi:alkylhydroperoxidase family enzyme
VAHRDTSGDSPQAASRWDGERARTSVYAGPGVATRYDDLVARLRAVARADRPAPPAFEQYLEKVRLHAYRVTDADVARLRAAGYSEDEIFEHTVAAAVAAGLERLDAGLATLR